MTTLLLVNATLLWYRNDRIYIRCAGLIAMDAVIVALAGICFHLSVPFLFEGRKGNQGADSYKGGVVPPPEGHVIRHPELRNGAGTVFGMSLGGLGLQVIAVLLWVKFDRLALLRLDLIIQDSKSKFDKLSKSIPSRGVTRLSAAVPLKSSPAEART